MNLRWKSIALRGIGICLFSLSAAIALFGHSASFQRTMQLEGPFISEGDSGPWTVEFEVDGFFLGVPADSAESRTDVQLLVNGELIGPGNASVQDIHHLGSGRYTYSEGTLLFTLPGVLNPDRPAVEITAEYSLGFRPWVIGTAGPVSILLALLLASILAKELWSASDSNHSLSTRLMIWLAPLSLVLLLGGGVLFYLNDTRESYLRSTPIPHIAYFPEAEFDLTFEHPSKPGSTVIWDQRIGVQAPWWVSRIDSGEALILRDRRLQLQELVAKEGTQPFVDLFGREIGGKQPGSLRIGENQASLRSCSGPCWHRVYLERLLGLEGSSVRLQYEGADHRAEFEFWGVVQGYRYRPLESSRPTIERGGVENPIRQLDPAPIRGGFVRTAEFKVVAFLDRAKGVDALWRVGTEDLNKPSSKKLAIGLIALGLLAGLTSLCFASVTAADRRPKAIATLLLFLGLTAVIQWDADKIADSNFDNHVTSAEAIAYLEASSAERKQLLEKEFGAAGWRSPSERHLRRAPERELLVPFRSLGRYGVYNDSSGYISAAWAILSNDHVAWFAPPVGFPVFASVLGHVFGLGTEIVAQAQTLLFILAGLVLAIAALNWSGSTPLAVLTLLVWCFYEDAARYTKYMFTETLGFCAVALVLAVCSFAAKDRDRHPKATDLPMLATLALTLVTAVYVRDVFVVVAWLLIAFLLSVWNRPFGYRLKSGVLIGLLFLLSWVPIPIIHSDRTLEQGLLALTPISLIRVDSFDSSTDPSLGGPPLARGLLRSIRSVSTDPTAALEKQVRGGYRFWTESWFTIAGVPFTGHVLDQFGRFVGPTLLLLAALGFISTLALSIGIRRGQLKQKRLETAILSLSVLLVAFTGFHTLAMPAFSGRPRILFAPVLLLCGMLTAYWFVRTVPPVLSGWLRRSFKGRSSEPHCQGDSDQGSGIDQLS